MIKIWVIVNVNLLAFGRLREGKISLFSLFLCVFFSMIQILDLYSEYRFRLVSRIRILNTGGYNMFLLFRRGDRFAGRCAGCECQ